MGKKDISKKNKYLLFFILLAAAFGAGYLFSQGEMAANTNYQQNQAVTSAAEDTQEETLINLNTADYYELIELDGIGDKTAKDIIAFRKENGGFNELQDLVTLGLLSQKVLDNIADKVEVSFPCEDL